MQFEWNEEKNTSNFKKHGIRFEEAARIFQGRTLTVEDLREDYGELREISTGLIGGVVCVVVVHTDRDGTLRLVSARPASKSERKRFDDYYQKNLSGN